MDVKRFEDIVIGVGCGMFILLVILFACFVIRAFFTGLV